MHGGQFLSNCHSATKKFNVLPSFLDTEGSPPCSQDPTTGSWGKCIQLTPSISFTMIHFNVTLSSNPRSYNWFLPLWLFFSIIPLIFLWPLQSYSRYLTPTSLSFILTMIHCIYTTIYQCDNTNLIRGQNHRHASENTDLHFSGNQTICLAITFSKMF